MFMSEFAYVTLEIESNYLCYLVNFFHIALYIVQRHSSFGSEAVRGTMTASIRSSIQIGCAG